MEFNVGDKVIWTTASYWGGDGAEYSATVIKIGKRVKIRTDYAIQTRYGQPMRNEFWVTQKRLRRQS